MIKNRTSYFDGHREDNPQSIHFFQFPTLHESKNPSSLWHTFIYKYFQNVNMYKSFQSVLSIAVIFVLFSSLSFAALTPDGRYDIGSPNTTALYISPNGNDANSGLIRTAPLRTIAHAWDLIHSNLSHGWSVELLPGTYSGVPYLEGASPGSPGPDAQHPIIFRATKGKGTVTINGDFNTHNLNYLYLINLIVKNPNGDIVHFTNGRYLLIRNCTMKGSTTGQETIKINQAQYVYIEDSEIYSADWNNIDFVAVQYGHIKRNKIHDATDWCMYFKGGSSYIVVDSNEVYRCGTGGISAGQGTGFNYMASPWINYEANDIKITNNIVHDTTGAGLGVNGGFNILMAYNTLYRVGSQSHTLETAFGMRQCEDPAICTVLRGLGGWGNVGLSNQPIPNKNVYIYNNVIFNPSGYRSQWNHFWIPGPRNPSSASGIPSPSNSDTNLQIKGNLIWNGPSTMPLGIEDSSEGCQASNPTCNAAQLRSQNSINRVRLALVSVGKGDYRLTSAVNLTNVTTYPIPNFVWNIGVTPIVPAGTLTNQVPLDRKGIARISSGIPGAYATTNATNGTTPPPPPPVCTLTCTSPQVLNSTSCSCYTPAPPPPTTCTNTTSCGVGYNRTAFPNCQCVQVACTNTCPSGYTRNTFPDCSCVAPPQPPSNNCLALVLPRSGNYVGALRNVSVNSESTIRNAINTALPGDVIKISPGNYSFGTQVWIEAKGTAANPIYVVANGARGSVRITTSDEGFNVGNNAAYLVFEGLEIHNTGNNIFHVQAGSNHITLRNLNLHDAGLDGDVVKINQANYITVEGCDIARPGARVTSENPYQEGIDLVDSIGSIVRYNFVHDVGNIGAYAKGSSRGVVFEYNVLDNQRSSAVDPMLGVGGWTDTYLLNGVQYEIYDMTVRHNLVSHSSYAALAFYDAYNSTVTNNRFLNNRGVSIMQSRAGNAPLAATNLARITNNQFIDTSGVIPNPVYQLHSHSLGGVSASGNLYWNNGAAIPSGNDFGFVPGTEPGAITNQNPNVQDTIPATYAQAMALLNWSCNGSGNTSGNITPLACTLTCTSPQILNATSCSCYTPVPPPTPTCPTPCGLGYSQGAYPGCACTCALSCTSPQVLNSTSCSCYTPVSSPTTSNSSSVRVYVAGESIEQRNRFLIAPFSLSGALIDPSNNDNNQFGWMVPFSDRLSLRGGPTVIWVGSDRWTSADDYPYSGTYPTSVAQNTSALSGSDISYWVDTRGSELRTKRFCYDVAFASFGGNGFGWMSDVDYNYFMSQLVGLLINGSSCNTNPVVYVTGHMPDGQVTGTAARHRYVELPRGVVSQFNAQNPLLKVRFIDMYSPFVSNTPTTAFPSPAWSSGGVVNQALISRSGDTLHPKRLASVYAGEIVANAINLSELPAGNSTTPPVVCTNSCGTGYTRGAYPGCTCTCSLSCISPQVLNSTSCSCYTPVTSPTTCTNTCGAGYTRGAYPGCACTCSLSCTSPQVLNSTSCSCYTPIITPSSGMVTVYVSGESIESRNRFVAAPFTSSGSLNGASNSNNEYGWMVPFTDRIKLRNPGLTVQFVGSGSWVGAEDFAYSGTYPSLTPLRTSALSGTSTDDWLLRKRTELTSRTFCYDVALIDRGGNDGWMDVTTRKDFIKQVVLLISDGSSCNPNPAIYVIAHMPDQFSTNQAPAYQGAPRNAVTELNVQYPSKNIRFVDVYGSFYGNVPTTAFPSPTWRSSSNFNFGSILLTGDIGHPARLASIYFGEIVANAVNLNELPAGNSTTPTTCTNACGAGYTRGAYPACACTCSLSCTSPQLLNLSSCSCYTPVAPPTICTNICPSGYARNVYPDCSCVAPVSPPTNGSLTQATAPIIPTITAAMKTHLQSVYSSGQASGKRSDVFAKVGDSITESNSYLADLGCPGGTDNMGAHSSLTSTVTYFSSRSLGSAPVWCGLGNSFTRASMVAVMGWTSDAALATTSACPVPNNSYLKCELATIQPSYAFIMYGTNDLQQVNDLTIYRANLNRIIDDVEGAGVIPVLSTLPPRLDSTTLNTRVAQYNAVVIEVAQTRNIPLWNYWRTSTLTGMVNQGLDSDGIHPNVLGGQYGSNLNTNGLTYGYNQRNLQTLQILEKLKRIVADNGASDS